MARDYDASSDEITHVLRFGAKKPMADGSTVHFGRHPSSKDHAITVTTRGGKVMSARVEHRPMQKMISEQKQAEAKVKARKDNSAAAQKAQLEKKRARSAANNTKKGNKTKN
jgi:uncharacterized protein YaiL (DUF2058 family)